MLEAEASSVQMLEAEASSAQMKSWMRLSDIYSLMDVSRGIIIVGLLSQPACFLLKTSAGFFTFSSTEMNILSIFFIDERVA